MLGLIRFGKILSGTKIFGIIVFGIIVVGISIYGIIYAQPSLALQAEVFGLRALATQRPPGKKYLPEKRRHFYEFGL